MKRIPNIDKILRDWPYEPNSVSVRMAKGSDNREVIQMRIEMGVLQLEVTGRPDGERPHDCKTYFEFLNRECMEDDDFVLDEEQCGEVDREFVQFYHRRICWLALRDFGKAVADADHTLALMDFCRIYSPDESWTMTHEQYRPFVLFHRTQAAALDALEVSSPDHAVEIINEGLKTLENAFAELALEDDFEDNELADRLTELRESLRQKFSVGRTLQEQLNDAIAAEEYERAAQLRDQLAAQQSNAQ